MANILELPPTSLNRDQWQLAEYAQTIARILEKCDQLLRRPGSNVVKGFPIAPYGAVPYSALDRTRFRSLAEEVIMSLDLRLRAGAEHAAILFAREEAFREHGAEYQQDQFPEQMIEDACRRAIEAVEVELEAAWARRAKELGR